MLFNVLNDESVAGLIGLVPAHLLRSHSLQYAHAGSAISVLWWMLLLKTNSSQVRVVTLQWICNNPIIANFLLSVTVKEFSKSVNILQRYEQEFFCLPVYVHYKKTMHSTTSKKEDDRKSKFLLPIF